MKHFLEIDHYSKDELLEILTFAEEIKANPEAYYSALQRKGLGLIFEKPSTRTRISFEVGMHQLGGFSKYLAPNEIQLGKREEIKDVARTMSRMLDVVVMRTFAHETLTEFAKHATIPVINGLTDYSHPAQAMADYLTIKEKLSDPTKVKFVYIGDGNNVLTSLLFLFSKLGVHTSFACPKGYEPKDILFQKVEAYAKEAGSEVLRFQGAEEAIQDADVVYTDVFISMGEEKERDEKLQAFQGFQLNADLLKACKKKPLIMHCLPAHRGEEITDDIIESEQSVVFDQAENRLHAQKGILYSLLK